MPEIDFSARNRTYRMHDTATHAGAVHATGQPAHERGRGDKLEQRIHITREYRRRPRSSRRWRSKTMAILRTSSRQRVHLDEVPQHIVRRGHNREPRFFAEDNYASYLHWLGEAPAEALCALHAYVLVTNHVQC